MIYTKLGTVFLLTFLVSLWITNSEAALAAMSVDFGSQFIKIGLVKPGVPMEIVLNKECRRKTPNVISIRNNERLFAEAAAALAVKHPKSAYHFLLSLIGAKEGSTEIELYKQRFPFTSITYDEERKTVVFPSEDEQFNVETLLAMVLWNCKQDTKAFAEQTVKDVVITVPAYFNQAERRAMIVAAEIAGLNLLQLMSDGSAAALNYGVFRRKEITEQAQTMLIYDMGAGKTSATLVEYLLEEDTSKKEKNPVVRTIGLGFDRTLGGLEMTKRLQKHLQDLFTSHVKTEADISTNPRAMAKLFKEAERVKQVLSANVDHFAQVESLHEDRDYKQKVTRLEFEQLIGDLKERIKQPVLDALAMAEMTIDKVDQFVLMGAGTRVPLVQSVLQEVLGEKEIGRFLNTDEAIALGAVYQAAHLSKSFRVLPFGVKEMIIYPIEVTFESRNDTTGTVKEVHRTLFGANTHYPAPKKTISLSSYTNDFTISMHYGSLSHLPEVHVKDFGATELAHVKISGLKEEIEKKTAENAESKFKGVKAQFAIDNSGIVSIVKAEAVVELPPEKEKKEEEEVEKLLTPEEETQENKTEGEKEKAEETAEKPDGTNEKPETNGGDKEAENKEENAKESKDSEKDEEVKEKPKPKPRLVKSTLGVAMELLDIKGISDEAKSAAIDRLSAFERTEKKKSEREAAMNALESMVYDLQIKVEDGEEFAIHSTDEEKEKIKTEVSRLRTWLEDDVGVDTKTEEFLDNKKILDDLAAKPFNRIKERLEMPKAVEFLDSLFNHSRVFLTVAEKNFTNVEDPVYTDVELDVLRNLINDTESWWAEKQSVYVKQEKNEDPAVTTTEMYEKMRDLDREVKYLMNKLKLHVPKKKPEEKKATNTTETKNKTEEKASEGGNEDKEASKDKEDVKENPLKDANLFEGIDELFEQAEKEAEKAKKVKEEADETTHDAGEF